jgi:DNA-directed RNA polymerase specialized sigma24 family protein
VPAADTNPDVTVLAAARDLEDWHLDLRADEARREEAVAGLQQLLLRAARFEVSRRAGSLPRLSAVDLDELAQDAADDAESAELLAAVREGIRTALTSRQREVLVAAVLGGVPIDVLAERLDSNRNAVYKVLHDARRRLRDHVAAAGFLEAAE